MPVVLALLIVCNAMSAAPGVAAETNTTPKTSKKTAPVKKEKPRVLFLDLTCTSVKPDVVETISDLVGAYLGEHKKYDVITGQDLRQMAKLEVEKQKSGCVDNSCLNEIAGAMGARYVVFGKVGKLADRTIITLNLFDSKEARAVDRAVVSAPDIGSIPDLLPAAVAKLMGGQAVVSPVIKSVEVAVPATPVATVPTASVRAPQEQLSEPLLSNATPAPVVEKENAVVEPTPSVVEPKSQGSKRQVSWVRVGSASALAAVGVGAALLMGVPQYNAMTIAENDYIRAATEDPPDFETTELKAIAQTEQASYMAGPVYWLWSGTLVAAWAGVYAVWAYWNAPLVTEENAEVIP